MITQNSATVKNHMKKLIAHLLDTKVLEEGKMNSWND